MGPTIKGSGALRPLAIFSSSSSHPSEDVQETAPVVQRHEDTSLSSLRARSSSLTPGKSSRPRSATFPSRSLSPQPINPEETEFSREIADPSFIVNFGELNPNDIALGFTLAQNDGIVRARGSIDDVESSADENGDIHIGNANGMTLPDDVKRARYRIARSTQSSTSLR